MKSLMEFLTSTKETENVDTLFQVLQSHGRVDECIEYAEAIKRYDTVIVHYINKQEYELALQKVTSIDDDTRRCENMLRYASIFLSKCAIRTIEELQKMQYNKIDIPKLMPAFQNIHGEKEMKYALDYITQTCILRKGSKSKTVHNMAFYFFSKINDSVKLIKYLEDEERKKARGQPIFLEVDYALNICNQNEKKLVNEMEEKRQRLAGRLRQAQNPNEDALAQGY